MQEEEQHLQGWTLQLQTPIRQAHGTAPGRQPPSGRGAPPAARQAPSGRGTLPGGQPPSGRGAVPGRPPSGRGAVPGRQPPSGRGALPGRQPPSGRGAPPSRKQPAARGIVKATRGGGPGPKATRQRANRDANA